MSLARSEAQRFAINAMSGMLHPSSTISKHDRKREWIEVLQSKESQLVAARRDQGGFDYGGRSMRHCRVSDPQLRL